MDHPFTPTTEGGTKCKWCAFAESAHPRHHLHNRHYVWVITPDMGLFDTKCIRVDGAINCLYAYKAVRANLPEGGTVRMVTTTHPDEDANWLQRATVYGS
jgi:hypothetical protein